MKVRLTRKYANEIDGVDLRGHEPGDVFDLSPHDANLLVAEDWAMPERRRRQTEDTPRRREEDFHKGEQAAS